MKFTTGLFAAIVLTAIVILMPTPADAQVIRIEQGLYNGMLTDAYSDSVVGLSYKYSVSAYPFKLLTLHPELEGLIPDSVVTSWSAVASSDSIKGRLVFKTRQASGQWLSTAGSDSIKAAGVGRSVFPASLLPSRDEIGLGLLGYGTGNEKKVTGNKNYLRIRMEWYFTKP